MTKPVVNNSQTDELLPVLQQIEAHLSAIRDAALRPERQWLTIGEVAEQLHLSRDTVERLIAAGKLKAAELSTRAGRGVRHRYRVHRNWVDAFLADSVRPPQKSTRERRRPPQLRSTVDFIG